MTGQTRTALFAAERHEIILRELKAAGRVEQATVARTLDVSGETVRKDLAALERQGLLQRVHGGAVPHHSLTVEPTVASRTEHRDRKIAIARAALAHLPRAGSILIDAGSTTAALTDLIPNDIQLTVYTNALTIAAVMVEQHSVAVVALGGRLRPNTMAAVGTTTLNDLRRINVDVAFLGTNGISLDRGMTTPDPDEAAVKAAMVHSAGRRILLADSSKFGLVSQCQHCDFADIDLLITDDRAPDAAIAAITGRGVDVELVEAGR